VAEKSSVWRLRGHMLRISVISARKPSSSSLHMACEGNDEGTGRGEAEGRC